MSTAPILGEKPKIQVLDSHTVNQIAAGEVVERPASVVKELVENSIDAGADRIEIELQDYGRALIRVSDNGCGMSETDAQSSLLRHATSKIRRAEDLQEVHTLGFRGEAVPSIASISRMTVSTAESEGLRFEITIVPGEPLSFERVGGPKGTEMRVEDLFFNTPARLKFLKSDTTELAACVECVSKYSVMYPEIAFSLKHAGSELISTTGSGDLQTAVAEIWGGDAARGLVEVDAYSGGVRVRGFVSPPHFTKPNRSYQWAFVNGRPVRSKTLLAAIDQAYRSLTPEKRYPVVVLMVDLDPSRLDANVSPTKSEVRFQSEGQVFDAVRQSIKGALLSGGMMPSAEGLAAANLALLGAQGAPDSLTLGWQQSRGLDAGPGGQSEFGGALGKTFGPILEVDWGASDHGGAGGGDRQPPQGFATFLDGLRVLGQHSSTFVIAENSSGLLIIDQHVAHERILYEKLLASRGSVRVERQPLLVPETLHLNRHAAESLSERLLELAAIGFELEPFGGESFLIRSVPAVMRKKNALTVLRDLVDELVDGIGHGCLKDTRDEVLILCSCKMAIKAGDPLTHDEMEKLLHDLAETENPYLCPHGRPITLVLGRSDLWRKFKRS